MFTKSQVCVVDLVRFYIHVYTLYYIVCKLAIYIMICVYTETSREHANKYNIPYGKKYFSIGIRLNLNDHTQPITNLGET